MWGIAVSVAWLEGMIVAYIILNAMIKGGAGSGLVFIILLFTIPIEALRIRLVIFLSSTYQRTLGQMLLMPIIGTTSFLLLAWAFDIIWGAGTILNEHPDILLSFGSISGFVTGIITVLYQALLKSKQRKKSPPQ